MFPSKGKSKLRLDIVRKAQVLLSPAGESLLTLLALFFAQIVPNGNKTLPIFKIVSLTLCLCLGLDTIWQHRSFLVQMKKGIYRKPCLNLFREAAEKYCYVTGNNVSVL